MTTVVNKYSGSKSSLLRIDSTESLDDTDLRQPTYSTAAIRRTLSMDGLGRSWRHDSDATNKKLSVSIAVSFC